MDPFPPTNFIEVESKLAGIEVYMPAPETEQAERTVVEFKCPQCGATTAYNVADGGLTCSYCSYYEAPKVLTVGKKAEKFEFTLETLERAAQGWGEVRKEMECQSCGGTISLPADSIAATCIFCGSNKVVHQMAQQTMLRPRFLIAFKVEAEKCQSIVRTWLGSSWMTPATLKELSTLGALTAVYLPYWTFHATTTAAWKAEVGHTVTEQYYDGGDKQWKTRTRIDWRWESGKAQLRIDDLLVPGTARMSALHLNQVKNYDLTELAPYEPKFLAGYQAKAYDVTLETAWEAGRQEMREQTRQACLGQASTNMVRNFSMTLDFSDESWRYLLLPVYAAAYHYEDKVYQVIVNGQTGAIAGQRPVDWNKVWLVIALILSPGLLLGIAGLITLPLAGVGVIIGGIGFVLLILGLIFMFILLNQANQIGAV